MRIITIALFTLFVQTFSIPIQVANDIPLPVETIIRPECHKATTTTKKATTTTKTIVQVTENHEWTVTFGTAKTTKATVSVPAKTSIQRPTPSPLVERAVKSISSPASKLLCLGNDGKTNKRVKCLVGEIEVAPNLYQTRDIASVKLSKGIIKTTTSTDIEALLGTSKIISNSQIIRTDSFTFVTRYTIGKNQSVSIRPECPSKFPICMSVGVKTPHFDPVVNDPRFYTDKRWAGTVLQWLPTQCDEYFPFMSVRAREELSGGGYLSRIRENNIDISWWKKDYDVALDDIYDVYIAITCAPLTQKIVQT